MTLILLTDDAILMERIEAGLAVHCPVARVIGHCFTVEAGIEATIALQPDLVLLDLDMPKAKKQGVLTILLKAGFRAIALTANEGLYRRLCRQSVAVIQSNPLDHALLAEMIHPES